MPDNFDELEHLSLCEALDRVLNKGAVVVGEVKISVANVELIYLGLQLVLSSVDSLRTPPVGQDEKLRLDLGLHGGANLSNQS